MLEKKTPKKVRYSLIYMIYKDCTLILMHAAKFYRECSKAVFYMVVGCVVVVVIIIIIINIIINYIIMLLYHYHLLLLLL